MHLLALTPSPPDTYLTRLYSKNLSTGPTSRAHVDGVVKSYEQKIENFGKNPEKSKKSPKYDKFFQNLGENYFFRKSRFYKMKKRSLFPGS